MRNITGTCRLGPGSGRVVIRTGRAGLAARAGHDLTIEITRWSAEVTLPGTGPEDARIDAELDLESLAVRAGSGGAKPLSDKDRRDIKATARRILGAGPDAIARFTSSAVTSRADGAVAEGTLTLRGRSRPVSLRLASAADGEYRGVATVRQTEFGITPYSGLLGALKLRDEIGIEVSADLNRAAW